MQKNIENNNNPRDHMANERTFLAWIRTSIGIIAFGFVIEKFTLFTKQMSFIVGKESMVNSSSSHGYSTVVGIFFVGFGTLMSLLSFIKFKKAEKQIDQGSWRHTSLLDLMLALVVFIMGIFLVVYLLIQQSAYAVPESAAFDAQRIGVVTMRGKHITLIGREIKIGQKAPDFIVQSTSLSDARLSDFSGKIKLIATVPSLKEINLR
jgi:putative membrane protein